MEKRKQRKLVIKVLPFPKLKDKLKRIETIANTRRHPLRAKAGAVLWQYFLDDDLIPVTQFYYQFLGWEN